MLGGYDDVARALIDAGAHSPDLLHAAARFSSPGMVRHLLSRGADPMQFLEPAADVIDERTPLDFAWKSYKDRVVMERERGPNDTEYLRGHDAEYVMFELLRTGAETNNAEIRATARDGVAEISSAPIDSQLALAARLGFFDLVAVLVDSQFNRSPQDLRDAVIVALDNDHDDIARLLLDNGAPVYGGVLHKASNASSAGLVRYLLGKGADPAERFEGKTAAEWWLETSSTQDPEFVLHELIVGGSEVCWLREHEHELRGYSAMILRDSAAQCWGDGEERPNN